MSVRAALHRLLRTLRDGAPAPYVWLYSRSGTTLRGVLVGRDREAYTLEHADVAPEGASGFRQVRGRLRIPLGNVDYWVEAQPRR